MPRAFPVPIYTTVLATPAPLTTSKRALSTTSPGTTDSTATTIGTQGLTTVNTYLLPESAPASNTAPAETANGVIHGSGWGAPIQNLIPGLSAGESVTVAAGTWTLTIHYRRNGGALTGNPTNVTFAWRLYRLSSNMTTVQQEIGRGTALVASITTTEVSSTINLTGAAATFQHGEYLYWEMHIDKASQVTADGSASMNTNSNTATRITTVPDYTMALIRGVADSVPATDGVARTVSYARPLADTAPATDAIARQVARVRAIADSAPASDVLARRSTYSRALGDAPAVTDALTRAATYRRSLADSATASDSLARRATYGRSLADGAGTVTDSLVRLVTANRGLADTAPVTDALTRRITVARSLADNAPVVDALSRTITYARSLNEALSAGGGVTVVRRFQPILGDD